MRAAALLVALVALVAGCTGTSEQPTGTPGAEGVAPTGLGNATTQVPSGLGGAGLGGTANLATAWVADYWGDRTEVALLDTVVTLANTIETPVSGCLMNCQFVFLVPEEDTFVAPGTERVELTATFTLPATAPGAVVNLFYRTAANAEPQGLELVSGEMVSLPIQPADLDAPLAAASQWWFFLNVQSPSVEHIPPFDVDLLVVAERGPALPEIPEAPDPWNGQSSIALLQAYEAPQEGVLYHPVWGYSCFNCNIGFDSQGAGLVPAGAGEVQATVTWDWATPTKPQLWYFNALTEDGVSMELVEDGATARTFRTAVPPDQVDSPYQERSHWGFFFTFDTGGQDLAVMHGRALVDATVLRAA